MGIMVYWYISIFLIILGTAGFVSSTVSRPTGLHGFEGFVIHGSGLYDEKVLTMPVQNMIPTNYIHDYKPLDPKPQTPFAQSMANCPEMGSAPVPPEPGCSCLKGSKFCIEGSGD